MPSIAITVFPSPQFPVEITSSLTDATWTTNAIGGFGSFTGTLLGPPNTWTKRLPKLSLLRVTCGQDLVWEGQIEDHELALGEGDMSTVIQAFGLANLLTEVSTRRIYSKRDMSWANTTIPDTATSNGRTSRPTLFSIQTGNFDPADGTKSGVQIAGQGTVTAVGDGLFVEWFADSGITVVRLMGTATLVGANTGAAKFSGFMHDYVAGWGGEVQFTANGAINSALRSNATGIRLGGTSLGVVTPTNADLIQFTALRVLGTSLTEDASGGFYGGTILRDLVALVPGLTLGKIADGSDFTIEAIEQSVRNSVLSLVQETGQYYAREYAVWDKARFDWVDLNLSSVDWLVDVEDLTGLNLRSSADTLSRTDYILYDDAAIGRPAESSTTSTSRANPYVTAGRTKDVMTSPGFPMTTNTSTQLSARLNSEHGQYPFSSGTCSLRCDAPVNFLGGGLMPAYLIRSGQNIKITGLPKDDPFNLGRDGQTLFHINSTTSTLDGEMTLALDSESHAIDALLARLAAVTRTITG